MRSYAQVILSFHKKYYHPSNSYIFIYGNADMKERLIWLDEKYLNDLLSIDEALGSRIIEMCGSHNLELRGRHLNYRLKIGGDNLC